MNRDSASFTPSRFVAISRPHRSGARSTIPRPVGPCPRLRARTQHTAPLYDRPDLARPAFRNYAYLSSEDGLY